jgi:hypothetical protein
MKQWIWRSPILVASVLTALSGCGGQSFDVVQAQQDSGPAGGSSIAPKVDLLLAVDNTGSTLEVQNTLNASIRSFLNQLNTMGPDNKPLWNFRVAAIPLSGPAAISTISASKYDANSANWVAPYPGAPHTSTILSSMYVAPENFQVYTSSGTTAGEEPGLANIGTALSSTTAQRYFLRPEAILAVVVLSNGDDTSDGKADYSVYPPLIPGISTAVLDKIKNAKGAALASSVHLIPVVAKRTGSCAQLPGSPAHEGTRYANAAALLGGHSLIDICSTPMSAALAQIQSQVAAIKLSYVKRFIQLDNRPNESTIAVVKNAANGAHLSVPKSVNGSDGWVYLGQTTEPMVSEPIEMDFRTGYMIQLIGDAYKLTGDETATVNYLPYGVTPSN